MFINFKSAHESKTYRRGNIRTRNTRRMILNWNVMLQRVAMYKTLRVRFNIFFLLKKKKEKVSRVYAHVYMVLLEEGSITLLKSRFATGVNRALIFLPPVYRTIRCANKERRRDGKGRAEEEWKKDERKPDCWVVCVYYDIILYPSSLRRQPGRNKAFPFIPDFSSRSKFPPLFSSAYMHFPFFSFLFYVNSRLLGNKNST